MRSSTTSPDLLAEKIRAAIADEFAGLGEDIARDIQAQMSVSVDVSIGPRGGIHLIRSKPGEAPRKETGVLSGSIDKQVENFVGTTPIRLTVFTECPYAPFLEYGTDKMAPRPVWLKTADAWVDRVKERLVQSLRSALER